ncbi:unnamed protein product [Leuciscus chuanchicus]
MYNDTISSKMFLELIGGECPAAFAEILQTLRGHEALLKYVNKEDAEGPSVIDTSSPMGKAQHKASSYISLFPELSIILVTQLKGTPASAAKPIYTAQLPGRCQVG